VSDFVRFFLLGLGPAGIYALLAVGIVLVYRGSGVVNFGAGGFALVGSMVYYEIDHRGGPLAFGIVAAIAVTAVLGVLVQVLMLRPMRGSSPLTRVVATLGIAAAAELGAKWHYGPQSRFVSSFLPTTGVHVGGAVVGADRLIILGISVVLTGLLWAGFRWTLFGIATTGVAENPRATACLAWSPTHIAAINWALGGALGGLAGVLLVPIVGFAPTSFTLLIVPALAVALIAQFRSFPLALLGGVTVGVLESESTLAHSKHPDNLLGIFPTFGLSSSVPFLLIIILMVVRGRALPIRGEIMDRMPRLGMAIPRPRTLVPFLCAVGISVLFLNNTWVSAISLSATIAVIALSLVVVTGYAGQLSLAQFALAGVAALVSARLADAAGLTFLLAGAIGVAVTVLVGMVTALPAVRVRGVNLAVITMALALVINSSVLSNTEWNGGAIRGTRVPDPTIFGLNVQSVLSPERWALVCLVALVISALVVSNLRRNRSGRRLIAIRDNERAAASLGVNVFVSKLYAFGLGGALAGVAGVLLAFRTTSVDFSAFEPLQSIEILLLTVIGGIGFIAGAVVAGSGVSGGLAEQVIGTATNIDAAFRFILALLFLVAIVIHPDGIADHFSRHVTPHIRDLLGRRRRGGERKRPAADEAPSDAGAVTRVTPKTLAVRDLTVRFGGVTALDRLSFEVLPGEVVGLIGPNGAGKTTVIDAVTGLLRHYEGVVSVNGTAIDGLKAAGRAGAGVTRSFQSLELFEDLSVRDNLRVAADDGGITHLFQDLLRPRHQELSSAVSAVVKEFDLSGVLDRLPAELSYAQRRTVAVARAVASNPSILLLDEPAAGLDAVARGELERLIRRLAEDWGMAVLLIEHDVALVMRTCDRVLALNFGRLIASGTAQETRHNDAVITAYLGEEIHYDQSAATSVATS